MSEENVGTGDSIVNQSLRRRRVLQLAASGTTLMGVGAGSASAEEEFVEIIGTDPSTYPEIDLSVSIDSDAGRDGELTRDEFTVYEEGEPVEIIDFEYSATALDLVFVFDDSGSMRGEISSMKRKVKGLTDEIDSAGIDARYGLYSFRDGVDSDLNFTDDASALKNAVDSLRADGGGDFPEDNFDAIGNALQDDFRDDAQKVIVDITDATSHYDGDGSGYTSYTLSGLAEKLSERGASFIAVSPGYDDPEASLKILAEETGGLWIDINDANFDQILDRITDTVIELYILRYRTDKAPGEVGEVGVKVEDPDLGTGESDSEVDIPDDAAPPIPEEFKTLRDEKLDLADRIETISDGTVEERADVSTVISNLESAIRSGDVDGSDAVEAVERLKLAENVTEQTLVQAGPAEPDDGTEDYDIATKTAKTGVDTVFTCILSFIPFRKVARRIPYADDIISTAKRHASSAIKRILDATLGRLDDVRYVKESTKEIANDIIDFFIDLGEAEGEKIVDKQTKQSLDLYDQISETLVDYISDDEGREPEPDLKEAIETVNDAADPTSDTTFAGSLSKAADAKDDGEENINDIIDSTEDAFSSYDTAFKAARYAENAILLAQIGGLFTGGLLTAAATVADQLVALGKAVLGLLKTATGYGALTDMRDEHAQTLNGITNGEGV